jgi:hypothetical protein
MKIDELKEVSQIYNTKEALELLRNVIGSSECVININAKKVSEFKGDDVFEFELEVISDRKGNLVKSTRSHIMIHQRYVHYLLTEAINLHSAELEQSGIDLEKEDKK